MHCRSCGSEQFEGTLSCEVCGATLDAPVRAPRPAPVAEASAAEVAVPPEPAPAASDERPRCAEHPEFPIGGACARCGKFICIRCSPELADHAHPRCEACAKREEDRAGELQGIGGWLILLVIQETFSALIYVGGGIFAVVRSLDPVLGVVSVGLGIYAFVTLGFVFLHKRIAPLLLLGLFALQGIDEIAAFLQGSGSIRGLVFVVAWSFYVLTSKRVKNTFVR